MKRYWLTPPELYQRLNEEFKFDFDPCPCPRPENYNSLELPWGKSNYVNPPFRIKDSADGRGPTAFVKKAIKEQELGNSSLLVLPIPAYVNLLLGAGAIVKSEGRVKWLEVETKEPWKSPVSIASFYLKGKK